MECEATIFSIILPSYSAGAHEKDLNVCTSKGKGTEKTQPIHILWILHNTHCTITNLILRVTNSSILDNILYKNWLIWYTNDESAFVTIPILSTCCIDSEIVYLCRLFSDYKHQVNEGLAQSSMFWLIAMLI